MNDPMKKSGIATGEEIAEIAKDLDGAVPVLSVVVTKKGELAFLGFATLTFLLQQGAEIEKYLNQKIATARAALVKSN